MSSSLNKLKSDLNEFGLGGEEADVYLFLLRAGYQSVLEISRKVGLPRTSVYRMLDKLKELDLVQSRKDRQGLKFKAAEVDQLGKLVERREQELEQIKGRLPNLVEDLTKLTGADEVAVKAYTGFDGIKVVLERTLAAQGGILMLETESMGQHSNTTEFGEELRRGWVNSGLWVRSLTNEERFAGFTQVSEFVERVWQCKYVTADDLMIKFETLIYNDVVVMLSQTQEGILAVEVESHMMAQTHRQMFEFVWDKAASIRLVDGSGTGEVV